MSRLIFLGLRMRFDSESRHFIRQTHWLGGYADLAMKATFAQVPSCRVKDAFVLDVWCCNGSKSEAFRMNRFQTIGMERDLDKLVLSRQRFLDMSGCCADAEGLPFQPGVFDIVFPYSVFQYINWRRFVKECECHLAFWG